MTDKELKDFGEKNEQFIKDELGPDKRFILILLDYDNPEIAVCSNMKRHTVEKMFSKMKYSAKEYIKTTQ